MSFLWTSGNRVAGSYLDPGGDRASEVQPSRGCSDQQSPQMAQLYCGDPAFGCPELLVCLFAAPAGFALPVWVGSFAGGACAQCVCAWPVGGLLSVGFSSRCFM